MTLPNCLETFYPQGIDVTDEQYNDQIFGGDRLSFHEVWDKYNIRFNYNPSPAPAELRKAMLHISNLIHEVSCEKNLARMFHRGNELKMWNTILAALVETRKALRDVNISLASEAKLAVL